MDREMAIIIYFLVSIYGTGPLASRHPGGLSSVKKGSTDMKTTISVILTAWMRPQYLEEQVERVLNQTIPPQEIVLWYNAPPKRMGWIERKQLVSFKNAHRVKMILCDHNFGIIPRFTLASCLEGEYVCIFDDDTMPGER